jgi:hypothetical protein
MSFAFTTAQVRARQKTVTRRVGWRDARPGLRFQPVKKSRGLPRGGKVELIGGPVRVLATRRERLDALLDYPDPAAEVAAEGFPGMDPGEFVRWFARSHKCEPDAPVTRIAFEYL